MGKRSSAFNPELGDALKDVEHLETRQ